MQTELCPSDEGRHVANEQNASTGTSSHTKLVSVLGVS